MRPFRLLIIIAAVLCPFAAQSDMSDDLTGKVRKLSASYECAALAFLTESRDEEYQEFISGSLKLIAPVSDEFLEFFGSPNPNPFPSSDFLLGMWLGESIAEAEMKIRQANTEELSILAVRLEAEYKYREQNCSIVLESLK